MTKVKNKCIFIIACGLISLTSINAQQSSLDNVLGVGKSDLADSKPETKRLWNELLVALEQGNFAGAKTLAHQFTNVIDYTEPYQMNFASTARDVLNSNYDVTSADSNFDENTTAAIAELQAKIAERERQIKKLEDKKPELQKKVGNANTGAAVIGALLGPQLGAIGQADKQNAEAELKNLDQSIKEVKAAINDLTSKIPPLQEEGKKVIKEGRNKAFTLAKDLMSGGHFREAIALSNTCIKKYGQDMEFVRLSQSAVDQQKTQNKAVAIAQAATKDASVLMGQNRLWEAKVEMERSIESIKERVNDASLLKFTEIELGKISRDLTRKIEGAMKLRAVILETAKRSATEAGKKYTEFLVKYPDFPEAEADALKLSDLKTGQIEAKFAKRIAAIEEVISNDTAEAKEMIKRLIADNSDPDEVSVIKSRMSKLEKTILQQEIKAIQSRLDEAQSFLTKWNVTFAASLKKGEQPAANFTASASGGVENLTRAISLQEGVVKQINVLLQDKMDNVTKSQVVALQETAKAALDYMSNAKVKDAEEKETAARNKNIAIGLGAFVLLIIIGGIFIVKRKRSGV